MTITEALSRQDVALPALAIAGAVNAALDACPSLVVTAPPGAGKSTILPLTVLEALPQAAGRIIVLEPRRLAARAVAERMAQLLGERTGETVGYRVRFESKVSAATRILVVTEGILTRMLIDDPTLDGVACVIFDEFHERSIHSDVALALTREAQQLLRPELRIVIMSATIDASAICKALSDADGTPAPLVESEGRMFPVEIVRAADSATPDNCVEMVAEAVCEAVAKHDGDILAFLPGEGEIRRCSEILHSLTNSQPAGKELYVAPLYGNLSLAEQHRAISPSAEGERKIVLATNIAETSLTIEGVRIVVDSGLCRQMVYDAQNGLSRLETVRISMDMATQRSGRAGRVAPGVCYRLWTTATEHRMAEQRTPEILTADLAPLVLDVAAWGESRVERLPWLTQPPRAAVVQATALLTSLGALSDGQLTPHGRALAQLPCHPRIAQMLLSASSPETKALACDIAALLEERDPMATVEADADLCSRLCLVRGNRQRYRRIARVAEQYRHMVHTPEDNASPDAYTAGLLLAAAYPERVAKAHPDGCGRFMLANGENGRVEQNDLLSSYDWLAVAAYNATSGRIFLAAPLQIDAIIESAQKHRPLTQTPRAEGGLVGLITKDNVAWDHKNNQIIARRELRIGCLVVSAQPLSDVPRERVVEVICEAAHKRGVSMFDFSADAVTALQHRVATVTKWHPELLLPDLSTDAVLDRVEEWLPFYLDDGASTASAGRKSLDLKRLDLVAALWSLLDYEQQQHVERLAPTHIVVPTGSRIRVEYRPAAEQPVLRVRLQECFGMQDTPRVDDGRQPVLMELLSPGFKPVQLTQDLRSFWGGTYFEVRKELRRRYPKHHWPDDPLAADPVRGVKRSK